MQKRFTVQIAVFALLLSGSAGCSGGAKKEASVKPSPSPSAKAKNQGLPLEAQLGNLDLTLLDEKTEPLSR
jgi:hypothetical protein